MSKSFYDVFIEIAKHDDDLCFDYDEPEHYPLWLNESYFEIFNGIEDDAKEYEAGELKKQILLLYLGIHHKNEYECIIAHKNPKRIIKNDLDTFENFKKLFNEIALPFEMNTQDSFLPTGIDNNFRDTLQNFIDKCIDELKIIQKFSDKKKKNASCFHYIPLERYYKNVYITHSSKEELKKHLESLIVKYNIPSFNHLENWLNLFPSFKNQDQ